MTQAEAVAVGSNPLKLPAATGWFHMEVSPDLIMLVQEHGLSVWGHDLLISHLSKPWPSTQIVAARASNNFVFKCSWIIQTISTATFTLNQRLISCVTSSSTTASSVHGLWHKPISHSYIHLSLHLTACQTGKRYSWIFGGFIMHWYQTSGKVKRKTNSTISLLDFQTSDAVSYMKT